MQRSIAVWCARAVLVVIGLLVAEAGLQVVSAMSPSAAARLSGLKPRYISDPLLDVRGDPESTEYDDAGFRNVGRPARATFVAIGDSQTEGSGVARDNSWPAQLARMTDSEVYQMAFGSYGPGQYVNLIDDALALSPAVVIVEFYPGNDLAEAYEWVYTKGRNPELRSSDPEVLRAVAAADREHGALDSAWRATRDAEKGLYDRPVRRWLNNRLLERSKLAALYEQIEWRMSGRRSSLAADAQPARWDEIERITSRVPADLLFAYEDGSFRTVFTPQGRMPAMKLEDPRIAEGLRITLAVFDRIAAATKGRAQLVALYIPTKEMVYGSRVRARSKSVPAAFEQRLEAEERVRSTLTNALQDERGIRVIDSLESLRSSLAIAGLLDDEAPLYPDSWDGHPAAAGYEAIARAVSDAILLQGHRAAIAQATE
jgi:lysophospholipase L1-like esterase